jgi:GTP cyclohydrolase II
MKNFKSSKFLIPKTQVIKNPQTISHTGGPMNACSAKDTQFEFVAQSKIPTDRGDMYVRAYRNREDGTEPVAIFFHNPKGAEDLPVRVHDACFTSEVLGSQKCDCREQLDYAMEFIAKKSGVVIYLQQEGRGIGLANKIAVYAAQETGLDTVEANRVLHFPDDAREYDIAAFIIAELEIKSISLMTNNPRKVEKLEELQVKITNRLDVHIPSNPHSHGYLKTKQLKMGHILNMKS